MSIQLDIIGLLQAIARTLNAFNLEAGSALIERALVNINDDPNNTQLLANLKQELGQLPPLTNLNIHGEMLWFIEKVIEYVQAANVINKKLVTRTVEKLYRGLEPYARNDTQRTALIEMQTAKDDALEQTRTEILAIGIEGDRHSLCGAIKRFELNGKQWNGLLSLKEQCARYIVLIKNEQIKWFITAYLSPNLFKYVTKDIFNLRRREFRLNYAKPLYMCQECTMDTYEDPSDDCQCPQIDTAIDALNNYLFQQKTTKINKSKKFEIIYKIPNDEMDHSDELKSSTSFFLYLSPSQYNAETYMDDEPFDEYNLINSHISAKDKLLFVDTMRFFGGFRTKYQEPQLIFYRRSELEL
ncbi:unnamed protein product [Rotaria sp. Silwood1]|nr:unnamed protein product [Rotaria sp. Silwood1]CAF3630105.1 unnamed protein product [Rotaria sp. Silwood1]CAF4675525.1 unnamed protein product [Rotaria sp. Silwood1]